MLVPWVKSALRQVLCQQDSFVVSPATKLQWEVWLGKSATRGAIQGCPPLVVPTPHPLPVSLHLVQTSQRWRGTYKGLLVLGGSPGPRVKSGEEGFLCQPWRALEGDLRKHEHREMLGIPLLRACFSKILQEWLWDW